MRSFFNLIISTGGTLVRSFFNLIEIVLNKIKPNLILFVLLLFFLAREIMGYIIANITNPDANQLIVGALLGILGTAIGGITTAITGLLKDD